MVSVENHWHNKEMKYMKYFILINMELEQRMTWIERRTMGFLGITALRSHSVQILPGPKPDVTLEKCEKPLQPNRT